VVRTEVGNESLLALDLCSEVGLVWQADGGRGRSASSQLSGSRVTVQRATPPGSNSGQTEATTYAASRVRSPRRPARDPASHSAPCAAHGRAANRKGVRMVNPKIIAVSRASREGWCRRTLCSALASFLIVFSRTLWACSSPWRATGRRMGTGYQLWPSQLQQQRALTIGRGQVDGDRWLGTATHLERPLLVLDGRLELLVREIELLGRGLVVLLHLLLDRFQGRHAGRMGSGRRWQRETVVVVRGGEQALRCCAGPPSRDSRPPPGAWPRPG
jgi:hypothetical protein